MNQSKELLDFVFCQNIIYYDGPLLSLGITKSNQIVLTIWIDENGEESYSLYAYVFISNSELELFLNNQKLYYDTLKDSIAIVTWKFNINGAYDFENISKEDFLEKYGPQKDVSLEDELKNFKPVFDNFENSIKKSSLIFK